MSSYNLPHTTVRAQQMNPLPTTITNNDHISTRYSTGLCCRVDIRSLKHPVIKHQENAVDTQTGLTFQWSGCLSLCPQNTKGAGFGGLEHGTQVRQPWTLVVSQHHWVGTAMSWVQSINSRELQGRSPHVGADLGNYGVFILSSFCKAHFYE